MALFGRKSKDSANKPATIREALAHDAEDPADQVDITEADAGRPDDDADVVSSPDPQQLAAGEEGAQRAASILSERTPRDVSDLTSTKGYINFGSLLVPGVKNQQVRLDIDQKSKKIVSLTIRIGEASLQVQAFSAPKSGGTWDHVRSQIEESVVKQKGRAKHVDGPFGKELHARVPTTLKDGRQGWRAARFIGFEGRRWFLRGVIGGKGAIDRKAAAGVETLFSHLVVNRGDEPLPPRELLPLNPPEGAKRVRVPRRGQAGQRGNATPTNGVHPGSPGNAQN
ncbi:DUF3710 domain-containing protein [Nesterenkonia sp. NBAIMH1]|uniref:DUF3710 domain-containing protein n=1 Tax=Nesterenkonia sp. NBAIMH1 TaxID=2600320 RepID=UPI0011B7425C|nr:DUF3710 domain-containing protein [Nesterenkonia sp. NBAIMH1]